VKTEDEVVKGEKKEKIFFFFSLFALQLFFGGVALAMIGLVFQKEGQFQKRH